MTAKKKTKAKYIEIVDTTLRDGEQMQGIAITPQEKLTIAKMLLDEIKVDRIEVASARVSAGEQLAVKKIVSYAKKKGYLKKVEVLGFVDYNKSVDWISSVGGRVINLLTKGSLKHCKYQLKKSPEEHLADIKKTISYAKKKKVTVNVYLEDWSNGMLNSKDYVFFLIDGLIKIGIHTLMLPDTLGVLYPTQVEDFISELIERYPGLRIDFHAHDDYGLATANTLCAIQKGVTGVHVTANGLGERAGNTSLEEVVVGINDFLDVKCRINEKKLYKMSKLVERFSGKRISEQKSICGDNVFTQTAGIHADGDQKGNLYANRLLPERFGRKRTYALGKLSGKASLDYNLQSLNIELSKEDKKKLLARIIELSDLKETITTADLPYIISDIMETPEDYKFKIVNCVVLAGIGIAPTVTITAEYNKKEYKANATGDGGYDAFMNALRTIVKDIKIKIPKLIDYEVQIPPGGKSSALVETVITWDNGMKTRGLNSDQVLAAIQATEKMLNLI